MRRMNPILYSTHSESSSSSLSPASALFLTLTKLSLNASCSDMVSLTSLQPIGFHTRWPLPSTDCSQGQGAPSAKAHPTHKVHTEIVSP